MKNFEDTSAATRARSPGRLARRLGGVAVTAVSLVAALTLANSALAAATPVPLGTADSFAVLGGAGITNTGSTTITGDVGTYPTATMTGFGSVTLNGVNHGGDAVTQGAKTDLVLAYDDAAGQGPTTPIVADLGGQTLIPGVYNSASSIGLTGALTLNGGGNLDAVFVFQAGSTLTTHSASSVNLINGAQACNIFWQIGSSATLGTGSTFRGTIMALTDITVTTGVTVHGRVLARNGAVTLDTDTITKPQTCTTQAEADAVAAAEAARIEAERAAAAATAAAEAARRAETAAAAARAAEAARVAAERAAEAARVAAAEAARVAAAKAAAAKAAKAARVAAKKAALAKKIAAKKAAAAKASSASARRGFTG